MSDTYTKIYHYIVKEKDPKSNALLVYARMGYEDAKRFAASTNGIVTNTTEYFRRYGIDIGPELQILAVENVK